MRVGELVLGVVSRVGIGVALALATGCVSSTTVACEGGQVCPRGTSCALVDDVTLCVTPDQLASCSGQPDLAPCGVGGACHDGVCLPVGCGNGRLDPDEVCDDGNNGAGDGCAADCSSDETCGNGVIDLARGETCDDGVDGFARSHDGCASNCATETARWTVMPVLGEISDAAIAYDTARDRVVLFAEHRGFAYTWEWDGARWLLQTPPSSPTPRSNHAMAYDPVRRRVVLFGGATFDDTWEWDGETWTLRTAPLSPPPRRNHVMAYDVARERVILFGGVGGTDGATRLADTWAWDGTTWAPVVTASAPAPRLNSSFAYDPRRGVLVLFGGTTTADDGETWELAGATWTQRAPATAPPPRRAAALAYDPRSGQILLHGGTTSGIIGSRTDAWLWDGTTWSPQPAGPALARHALAGVLRQGHVIAFDRGKTYRWDGAWTLVDDATPTVLSRQSAAAAVDVRGRRVVIHGGIEGGTVETASTLVWTGAFRRYSNAVAGSGPGPLAASAMVFDARRNQFVLFGGVRAGSNAFIDETWVLDGLTWTQKVVTGARPAPRAGHVLVYDVARERTVLFGGLGPAAFTDTWLWDGEGWQLATPTTSPTPRDQAAATYDPIRERVVMFGGFINGTAAADTWEWDGTTWIARAVGGPAARGSSAMAWDLARGRVVMFGGATAQSFINDQWEWDGASWAPVPAVTTLRARANHVMVSAFAGGGVLALGGTAPSANVFDELAWLRWDGVAPEETCDGEDRDGDGARACADADCQPLCAPLCVP
ncbi:MAG: hypothetical protein M3680_28300, partial [Myxococcota bacterium]|nr:hypothetical protein [Myxococcota bacterium]